MQQLAAQQHAALGLQYAHTRQHSMRSTAAQHAQHSSTAACTHVYTSHACICARSTYIYMRIYACMHMYNRTCAYICMHEHMYMHMHMHMYIVGKQYSTSFIISAAVYVLYKYYTRTIDSTVHV